MKKSNQTQPLIIPKTEVSIALYRKSPDGNGMQKALLGLDELISKYSVVNQFSDLIFQKHMVEEAFIPEELSMSEPAPRKAPIKQDAVYYDVKPEVADLLKEYRTINGVSQKALAGSLGFQYYHVTFIEQKRAKPHRITEEMAEQFADLLGINVEDVIVKGE